MPRDIAGQSHVGAFEQVTLCPDTNTVASPVTLIGGNARYRVSGPKASATPTFVAPTQMPRYGSKHSALGYRAYEQGAYTQPPAYSFPAPTLSPSADAMPRAPDHPRAAPPPLAPLIQQRSTQAKAQPARSPDTSAPRRTASSHTPRTKGQRT